MTHSPGDDERLARQRRDDDRGSADRAWDPQPEGKRPYFGVVYYTGARPAAAPVVVLTRPVLPHGRPVEGDAVGLRAAHSGMVPVTMLRDVPFAGDVVLARLSGGRWVSDDLVHTTACPDETFLFVTVEDPCWVCKVEAVDTTTGLAVATETKTSVGGPAYYVLSVPPGTYRARVTNVGNVQVPVDLCPPTECVVESDEVVIPDGCTPGSVTVKLCCPGRLTVRVSLCVYGVPCSDVVGLAGHPDGSLVDVSGVGAGLTGNGTAAPDAICWPIPGGSVASPPYWDATVTRARFRTKTVRVDNNCCNPFVAVGLEPDDDHVCSCCCDVPTPRQLFFTDSNGCGGAATWQSTGGPAGQPGWKGCCTYSEPNAASLVFKPPPFPPFPPGLRCCVKVGGNKVVNYFLLCQPSVDGYGAKRVYWNLGIGFPSCQDADTQPLPGVHTCGDDWRDPDYPGVGGDCDQFVAFGRYDPVELECGSPVNIVFNRRPLPPSNHQIPTEMPTTVTWTE